MGILRATLVIALAKHYLLSKTLMFSLPQLPTNIVPLLPLALSIMEFCPAYPRVRPGGAVQIFSAPIAFTSFPSIPATPIHPPLPVGPIISPPRAFCPASPVLQVPLHANPAWHFRISGTLPSRRPTPFLQFPPVRLPSH